MNQRFTVAIQPDVWPLDGHQVYSFSEKWIDQLHRAGHTARRVDVTAPDFFQQLAGCDGFMWWFPPIGPHLHHGKRLMIALAHAAHNLPVFPQWRDCWHFDDKIAQAYLLQSAGIPTPRTWILWRRDQAHEFCRTADYPLVLKLSGGFRSKNVRLLRSAAEAGSWVNRLFGSGRQAGRGPSAPPSAARALRRRLSHAARRVVSLTRRAADGTDPPSNYLLVQEFLPGNQFDTRIIVIGDRAFGVCRFNRPGDFRASGSGLYSYDPAAIREDAVRLAFRVAKRLQTRCMSIDVLTKDDQPVVGEISYFFGWSRDECPGYWQLHDGDELAWTAEHVYPEALMLADFLKTLAQAHRDRPSPQV